MIEDLFEPVDLIRADSGIPGETELSAEIEEFMLDVRQYGADRAREIVFREQQSDRAVEFIDRSKRLHTRAVFRRAGAVTEARRALVASSGVNL